MFQESAARIPSPGKSFILPFTNIANARERLILHIFFLLLRECCVVEGIVSGPYPAISYIAGRVVAWSP